MDPRPFLAAHLLSSCASSCFSCSFPLPPSLSLSPSLHFTLSRFVRLRSSFWRRCSPVLRTATRANITTGSSRGHGVTVDGSLEPFLRSPGIITGPPWGFTRPEVRHQRDTCSTLTIIAGPFPLLLCSLPFVSRSESSLDPCQSFDPRFVSLLENLIEEVTAKFTSV